MSTDLFTGKADFYAKARPGYPDAATEYVLSLAGKNAVFADIGAGTGKFAELLAKRGAAVRAVEPNADMRSQLALTLAPYPNATVFGGSAEETGLPDGCADAVTCAQALHWFDPAAFRAECRRIARPGGLVIAVYNDTPGNKSMARHNGAIEAFFRNPATREFPNPITHTKESWRAFSASHSHDPLPGDPGYAEHIAKADAVFGERSVNGVLRLDVVTRVYSELI